jgi:hypothetical protein
LTVAVAIRREPSSRWISLVVLSAAWKPNDRPR